MKLNPLLPPKHRIILEEYLKNGFNGTEAYLVAYPDVNRNTAKTNGSKVIKHPLVQAEIMKYQMNNKKKNDIEISYIIENLMEIVESSKLDDKVDRISILKALDQLSKISGLYVTNIKTEVVNPLEEITINIIRSNED